jgi:hypothetical protein
LIAGYGTEAALSDGGQTFRPHVGITKQGAFANRIRGRSGKPIRLREWSVVPTDMIHDVVVKIQVGACIYSDASLMR